MIRIIHTFGTRAGATEQVAKPVVRFGRAPDNDVIFDPIHDRDAGSHHAEVRAEGGQWVLVDLQSRNGLFVRGHRVARHPLTSGDEITFGANGPRIRVEFGAPHHPAHANPQAAHPAHPAHQPAQHHAAQHHAAQHHAAQAVPNAYAAPPNPAHHHPAAANAYPAPPNVHAASAPAQAPALAAAPLVGEAAATAKSAMPPGFSAAGSAPAEAPPAGKRVGQRTMAWMIESAVNVAGKRRPGKTQAIQLMVEQHVEKSAKKQRRRVYAVGCLLLVALGALGGVVAWNYQSQDGIAELREDLNNLPVEDPRRKEIESRLGKLNPENSNFGRGLYEQYKKGIFMLSARGQGFCTAFAVEKNKLATNAHCVKVAQDAGGKIEAVENEGRGKVSFVVTDMKPHPGYRHNDPKNITPDVGIVTIRGQSAVVLDVAKNSDLKKLGAGDAIYMIGFPGRLMNADDPAATFLSANIGRVTDNDGKPSDFDDNWLIQHDGATTKGTSGSPIFNGDGKVIGINAGGYLEGDDQTIAGRKTEVVRASPYKFGMRIDLIKQVR